MIKIFIILNFFIFYFLLFLIFFGQKLIIFYQCFKKHKNLYRKHDLN